MNTSTYFEIIKDLCQKEIEIKVNKKNMTITCNVPFPSAVLLCIDEDGNYVYKITNLTVNKDGVFKDQFNFYGPVYTLKINQNKYESTISFSTEEEFIEIIRICIQNEYQYRYQNLKNNLKYYISREKFYQKIMEELEKATDEKERKRLTRILDEATNIPTFNCTDNPVGKKVTAKCDEGYIVF